MKSVWIRQAVFLSGWVYMAEVCASWNETRAKRSWVYNGENDDESESEIADRQAERHARPRSEAAAGLCLSRTHYDIEIEHYVTKLLDSSAADFGRIAQHFGIDKSRLAAELNRSLDKLKSGNARTPRVSPTVIKMLTEAWTIGSIDFSAGQVRTGFTILALVTNDELSRLMREISREFQKIQPEVLRKDFAAIVADSSEETVAAAPAEAAGARRTGPSRRRQDSEPRSIHGEPDRECEERKDRSGPGPRF